MGTGGRNPQEKEPALRYQLHMATIHGREPGDVAVEDGERMMERLRSLAATANVLLSQKEGDVGGVVEAIGGTLRAPHMDRYERTLDGAVGLEVPRC